MKPFSVRIYICNRLSAQGNLGGVDRSDTDFFPCVCECARVVIRADAAGVRLGESVGERCRGCMHLKTWFMVRNYLEITLSDVKISGDGFRSSILRGIDLCGD